MTARRTKSQVVRLCLPIASAVGRLDPPCIVRVTVAAAEWLTDHQYAQPLDTPGEGAGAIDLTGDERLTEENARPGDTYWDPERKMSLRRRDRTEWGGDVQTRFYVARSNVDNFRDNAEMLRILAPAIAAMDAAHKSPLLRLTERDVKTIEHALDDLAACWVRFYERLMENKHIAPRKKGGKSRAKQIGEARSQRNAKILEAYNGDPDKPSFAGRRAASFKLKPAGLRAIVRKEKKKT